MSSLLIVEDEHALAAALSTVARRLGAEPAVAASGRSGLEKLARRRFDLLVLDIGLPDMSGLEVLKKARADAPDTPVIIITAHGTLDNALEAKRLGAAEYLLKPLDLAEFQQALRAFLDKPASAAGAAVVQTCGHSIMIGAARAMQRAFAAMAQACGAEAAVLISGPSGAGKSLAARVIHANSARRGAAFERFRADEWAAPRLEEALFGGGSGGGAFQRAAGGVLFIEEVADLPLPAQAALEQRLHAAEAALPRIIAATARDLPAEVREGRFREDLFYRLKIMEVTLPALRERTEDIPALASFFLSQAAGGRDEPAISESALAALKTHHWPGNVRELRNAMQHAAAVCAGPVVLPRHLPEAIARSGQPGEGAGSHLDDALQQALGKWLDQKLTASEADMPAYDDVAGEVEAMMLKTLLPRFDHKPTRLATAMKMNRATLRRKCRDLMP